MKLNKKYAYDISKLDIEKDLSWCDLFMSDYVYSYENGKWQLVYFLDNKKEVI